MGAGDFIAGGEDKRRPGCPLSGRGFSAFSHLTETTKERRL